MTLSLPAALLLIMVSLLSIVWGSDRIALALRRFSGRVAYRRGWLLEQRDRLAGIVATPVCDVLDPPTAEDRAMKAFADARERQRLTGLAEIRRATLDNLYHFDPRRVRTR